MDEIDQLTEQPPAETRRAVVTATFEFPVRGRRPEEDLRESLLEALRVDAELQELPGQGHPKVLGIAVDPPEAGNGKTVYRVHVDFEPGNIDGDRIREIIQDNLDAELLAA